MGRGSRLERRQVVGLLRRRRRGRGLRLERSGPWIGVAGLFVLLWLTVTTITYAPWWGVALLLVLLVAEAVLVARWARERPEWCVAVPVVGFVLWLGGALLLR